MVNPTLILTVAALSAPLVAGHGLMGLPKTEGRQGGDNTAPVSTISSSQFKAPAGMSFSTDPESNTKAFTAWIKTSEYKSLKDLILKKGGNAGECGYTKVGAPQPLPAAVEWTHGASEGFTPSHMGPCEVWCDDEMAFHDDNCAKNFPTAPAKLPYDKSKCEGKKQLATYWLALHSTDWQVYIGCAAIESRSGGGGGGSAPAPAPAGGNGGNGGSAGGNNGGNNGGGNNGGGNGGGNTTPKPSNATPTVKPATPSAPSPAAPAPAPAAGGSDEDCDEEYPEPAGGDADCDEDLPEPAGGDADCDEDLPEPDCDDDLPEPKDSEYGGDADVPTSNIGFGAIQRKGGESAPGKVSAKQYK